MTATAAILPIRDEATYEATLAEVRRLWSSAGGTPEGDRLEVLTILVEAYEQEHHPIGLPDPIEAIKARMGDLGLQREDLCAMLGIGSGRVSELLTFRRPLALDMIRTLAVELSLSEVCLVQRYDLVPAAPKRGRPRVQAGRIGKKAVLIHKKAFGIRLLGLLRRWGRILNPRDHSTGSAAARPWA